MKYKSYLLAAILGVGLMAGVSTASAYTGQGTMKGNDLDITYPIVFTQRPHAQRRINDDLYRLVKDTVDSYADKEFVSAYMDSEVTYEDDDVILINKPKGMVVHPAAGHTSGTIVNALLYHCKDSLSGINGVIRPGIVHRIDMDTTGVIIACKNDASHNCIAAQLKEHSITRRYYAIVHGNLKEDEGVIDAPIGRDPNNRKRMAINHKNGKNAVTHYKVLERFGRFTWIECRLETGRTHQIRVHMASIGHSLLGDALYGPTKCPYQLQGQTLHAYVLGFIHPSTGEYMEFQAPLPDYFEDLLKKLRQSSAG